MTIKNSQKNISAENGDIVLSITNNTPAVTSDQSTFVDDLTLTISQKNFIDEDNRVHYETIDIPLSELARLEYLHSRYYNKSAVDDIMALYYTIAQIQNNYYSKTEVDNKIKVHFDVRNALPSTADAEPNYVYLIPFEQGEADYQEGFYKEYVYVESQNNFEMIGSTKLDLSSYLRIIDLNAELLNASNFTDLQDEVDGHSDSISSMQTDIYYLLNKLGFSRDGIDNYNYAVVQDGYWFLSNVDYDYPRKRFVKINKNLKSLGIQVKGEDINIWINDGREEVNIPNPYNEDYDYSDSLTYDYIGALNIEEDKWESFDIPHGWINLLSITNSITNFANEVSVDNSRVLTMSDYDDLLEQIEEYIPEYDTELANTQNAVQNSVIYAKTNSLENAITAIEDLSNSTFKNTLWDFIWGSSGFVAENGVTRGVTNLGSFIYDYIQNTLGALNTSILNQIEDAIDTHNTSNNAHSTLLNNYVLSNDSRLSDARTPLSHTHTTSDITNLSIPTKTSDLTNDNGFITSQDISGKADISDIPTKTSDLTNDSDYITSTEVGNTYATKDAIDNIIAGDIDLTGYAKSNEIPTKTSDLTNDNGFITSQDISSKADITDIPTKTSDLTNDSGFLTEHQTLPTYATVATSGSYNDLDNKPSIPTKTSDLTNDGDGINAFLTEHQTLPTYATVATSGDYSDLSNTPNLSDLGGVVTVEKQQNAEGNNVSTYIVKQNGTQVGAKINIPKDFLVKSASVNTCSTTGTPNGFTQGDKYIDFIINSKDNDDTDEHLYINVNDLVDTYTAGTGLTLNNNTFSVNIADLSIPTKTSDLTNDNGFITSQDISGKEDKSNIVTSTSGWNSTTSDTKYPSEKLVKNSIETAVNSIHGDNIPFNYNSNQSVAEEINTKANINDIPTKTSDLTNDSGFLTSVTAHTDATASNVGQATNSVFGHTKLSDSYTSNAGAASQGISASSKAVYDCYTELDAKKNNRYALYYGNSSSNSPIFITPTREDPLEIKQGTPLKVYVWMNGENICNTYNPSDIHVKYDIADTLYVKEMDTTDKCAKLGIQHNVGTSEPVRIYIYYGDVFLASDMIQIVVVNNYS